MTTLRRLNFKHISQHTRHVLYVTFFIIFALFFNTIVVFSQDISQEELGYDVDVKKSKARFDFYEGVSLLNSGNVAESVVALQRAVAIDNDNSLVKYWLSRANNAYGQTLLAHNMWKDFVVQGFQTTYFSSQLELAAIMKRQNITTKNFKNKSISSFIRATSIDTQTLGYKLPMSIRMLSDNTMILSSLGSNTVSVLSPTGQLIKEIQKNTVRLSRPTDSITLSDESILVSEFLTNGVYQFLSDGTPLGQFIKQPVPQSLKGPQFLATDEYSNVYVSTFGSARILKFNSKGEFLFDFGAATDSYTGLLAPTGIAVVKERVWVLDNRPNLLYVTEFDTSGNFISRYGIDGIQGEGLRAYGDILLITSTKQVIRFDTKRASITDILSNADFKKLTSAEFDNNDMLWIVDQGRGRIEAFSDSTGQYSGLSAKILSVRTENFPTVKVRISVHTPSRTPVVGLKTKNFVLFEDNVAVNTKRVLEDSNVAQGINTIIIPIPVNIEIPQNVTNQQAEKQAVQKRIVESVNLLISAMSNTLLSKTISQNNTVVFQKLWVMKSGLDIGYEIEAVSPSSLVGQAVERSIGGPIDTNTIVSSQENTLRFAINTLLPLAGKKSIVFMGDTLNAEVLKGSIWKQMLEIVRYYGIDLLWVSVRDRATIDAKNDETTRVFISELNNLSLQNFNDGIRSTSNIYDSSAVFYYPHILQKVSKTLLERLQTPSPGIYSVVFQSKYRKTQTSGNGQYVGLSAESYYFTRSGKDFAGYVVPQIP